MAIKSADQISIVDLTDGYSVILTNDSFTDDYLIYPAFIVAHEIILRQFFF